MNTVNQHSRSSGLTHCKQIYYSNCYVISALQRPAFSAHTDTDHSTSITDESWNKTGLLFSSMVLSRSHKQLCCHDDEQTETQVQYLDLNLNKSLRKYILNNYHSEFGRLCVPLYHFFVHELLHFDVLFYNNKLFEWMKHFNKCKDYHEQVQASRLTKLNWYHQTSFKQPLITSDRTNYIHITLFVNKTQIIRVCFTLKKVFQSFCLKILFNSVCSLLILLLFMTLNTSEWKRFQNKFMF